MDTAYVFMAGQKLSWAALGAAYASGIVFNLILAGATVLFLLVLAKPLLNKLARIKKKHGVFR